VDPLDVGGGQRLLQHADDGHDAGHGALEAQLDAVLAGARPQLLAVLAEQLLVGGDDVLARLHRAQHVVAGGVDPADQLDDQVAALEHLVKAAARAREDAGDLRPHPGDRHERIGALGQQRGECRADRPVAQEADPKDTIPTHSASVSGGFRRRAH
jgi:hypothetical protein